jgi:hypothetical protein
MPPANETGERMGMRIGTALVMALTAVSAMLAGCAAPGPTQHSALAQNVKADEGVVLMKVIGVQPLSAFNAKWGTLRLVEQPSGRSAELRDAAPGAAGYSLFIGSLPPGRYAIAGFHSDGMAPATFGVLPALVIMGMTSDSRALGTELGSFSVRPGTLTNLGVVVSALPEDKKSPFRVAVMADAAGLTAALADVEPASRSRMAAMPVLGWDKAPDPDAAARALDIVRTHARNVSAMEVLDGNRLAIGSALGMLHVRSPQGPWSSMSTGSLDNITLVRSLSGGRIFAATDNGRYHLWIPEQQVWRSHALPLGERIVHLEPVGGAGYAMLTQLSHGIAMTLPGRNRVLLKADLEAADAPRLVLALDGASAMGRLPMIYNGRDLLVIFNHVGVTRTADLYRIDPSTGQHRTEKLDHWTQTLYALPDGLLVRERMNALSVYSDFSADKGAGWVRNDTAGPVAMHFADRQRGYGVTVLSTGWSTLTMALNKTSSGGKQWARVGTPFETTGPASVRVLGDTVFVYTGKQLLSTRDEGATWTVEWPRAPAP